jgi:hypothetical protein
MPWGILDDKFHSHPKTRLAISLDPTSITLWAVAYSWIADQRTDGFIPAYMLGALAGSEQALAALLKSGLWKESADRDGWVMHDYLEYNRSKKQIESDRAATSKARSIAGKKGAQARSAKREQTVNKREANGEQNTSPIPKPIPIPIHASAKRVARAQMKPEDVL